MRELHIATAIRRNASQWSNKSISWSEFADLCRTPRITWETVAEYAQMTKDQQGAIKDVGGFVGGYLIEGKRSKRSVKFRDLITLDMDSGRSGLWETLVKEYPSNAFLVYSTHKHTNKIQRLRLVMPLDRSVSPEEYEAISRAIAAKLEQEQEYFDPTTFAPERLMYWPSHSKDGDWYFKEQQGEAISADGVLDTYIDWRDTSEWPGSKWGERVRKKECLKQGDPTEKPGIVGTFCRTYDIHSAIEKYLSDIYEPAGDSRYTYKLGTVSAGLVLYEDGKFAYSHNATDPCSLHLVNAFDLVRIHLFADRDEDSRPETPITKLPSFSAMQELAAKDSAVRARTVEERIKAVEEDFKDVPVSSEEESEDSDSWKTNLKLNKYGNIVSNSYNIEKILEESPYFKGLLWHNDFNDRICVRGKLPWGANPKEDANYEWQSSDDSSLRVWLDINFGIQGKDKIYDAIVDVATRHGAHPVRDYLNSLPAWDGTPRLDTLFVDFVGSRDTELTRAFTRKHFIAAIGRILRLREGDGKHDQILTIVGKEGTGKSTLIRKMGGPWYYSATGSLEGKDGMQGLVGTWVVEVAELIGVKRSENEFIKDFLSREEDRYRAPYARGPKTHPRECVFFATTNEKHFLRGDTGNRRYWLIEPGDEDHKKYKNVLHSLTNEYRDQVWAEALHYYRCGESTLISEEQMEAARELQEEYNELSADERFGMIKKFLEQRLPADWSTRSMQRRAAFFKDADPLSPDGVLRRDVVSNIEIYVECFGESPNNPNMRYVTRNITSMMARMEGWEKGGIKDCGGAYGRQRVYKRIINEEDTRDDEEL